MFPDPHCVAANNLRYVWVELYLISSLLQATKVEQLKPTTTLMIVVTFLHPTVLDAHIVCTRMELGHQLSKGCMTEYTFSPNTHRSFLIGSMQATHKANASPHRRQRNNCESLFCTQHVPCLCLDFLILVLVKAS